MEILLETKDPNDIINLIQSILEEEFFALTGLYECPVPEFDYWIKSEIIDRLSNPSVSFVDDRFSEPGGNLINDSIKIFIKTINDVEFQYLVVENEQYIDQHPYIYSSEYEECWWDYNKAFELFRNWAYSYINKTKN